MDGKGMKALAVAALVAAALALSCSDGVLEPGDVYQGHGSVHYFPIEGGFWALEANDGEVYDPITGVPPAFEQEGLRVEFVVKITDAASVHMVGRVVELRAIWREGSRFPY